MKSFDDILDELKQRGMKTPGDKVNFHVPEAENTLKYVMDKLLQKEGRKMAYLPEYGHVASWLDNNQGRGLFMYGNCGRGKSLLCRYAIPIILLKCCRKVVSVYDIQDMNNNLDDILKKKIISLDDIGTEEGIVKYGERRDAFPEIMDMAEKNGNLVIVSTNLGLSELGERYGDRVVDRIKSTTVRVLFEGESLRK